jgi:hypothetical protein
MMILQQASAAIRIGAELSQARKKAIRAEPPRMNAPAAGLDVPEATIASDICGRPRHIYANSARYALLPRKADASRKADARGAASAGEQALRARRARRDSRLAKQRPRS